MGVATEAGARFGSNPQRNDEALLLGITTVNPRVSTNLVACHANAIMLKNNNKCRGSLPVTCSFLLLALSTCGEVGLDVQTPIKHLVIRRVEHRSVIHS